MSGLQSQLDGGWQATPSITKFLSCDEIWRDAISNLKSRANTIVTWPLLRMCSNPTKKSADNSTTKLWQTAKVQCKKAAHCSAETFIRPSSPLCRFNVEIDWSVDQTTPKPAEGGIKRKKTMGVNRTRLYTTWYWRETLSPLLLFITYQDFRRITYDVCGYRKRQKE